MAAITLVFKAKQKPQPADAAAKPVEFPSAVSATHSRRSGRASSPKKRREFQFPEKRPSADAMLNELGVSDDPSGYGSHRWDAAKESIAKIECELFNDWVTLRARTLGLRAPGRLSVEQFTERYW